MFRVMAKETTVTIGTRVFSPAAATCFQDELPPEVAERIDLLTIEEVPDAESTVDAGGLSATGMLQTGHEGGPAAGPEAGAAGPNSAPDGEGAGDDANQAGRPVTGDGGQGCAPDGEGANGDADPTVLTDEALTNGVAVISVGDGEEEDPGSEPDPFADPVETLPPADPPQGAAAPPAPAVQGRGKGGAKGSRK